MQQLDQRHLRERDARPRRPRGHCRHRVPEVMGVLAYVTQLLAARPGRHRRQRSVLLLRAVSNAASNDGREPRRGSRFFLMNDLSLAILSETADDAVAVERLHERTFGPGRMAK